MPENERLLRLVCASAKRALHGQTPATLLAYSFAIDEDHKRILLRAHFGEQPSEDEMDTISIVEAEIDADFLGHFEGKTDIEVAAWGAALSLLPGGIAYRREG